MIIRFVKSFALVLCALISFNFSANAGYLSPQNFDALYAMAKKGNVTAINNARARGLDIDSTNANGDTGLCVAAKRRDKKAYKSFLQSGANPSHYCTWNIVGYREFIQSVINTPAQNIDTAVKASQIKEGMSWKTKTLIGTGVVALGAGVGLALGGGGGGSSYDPNCVHGYYNKDDICACYKGYAGTKCNICADGYDKYGTSQCHLPLACDNGEQKGGKCVCETGYSGTLCDVCAEGYGRDSTGVCVRKGQKITGNTVNTNKNQGTINIENEKYTDLYGLFYDAGQTFHGLQSIASNRYSDILSIEVKEEVIDENGETTEEEVEYLVVNGSSKIKIKNTSDSKIYGLYSNNAQTIYNNYLKFNGSGIIVNSIATKGFGDSSSLIEISSEGDGHIYGIYGNNAIYSGDFTEEGATDGYAFMSSVITITNKGNGNAYGIYNNSPTGIIYHQTKAGNFISLTSQTVVQNTSGKGNTYGLYGLGTIVNSGEVRSSADAGNAYGIYTKGGTISNINTNLADSVFAQSVSGNSYGAYLDGGSIVNGRVIYSKTVDGSGTAYGIYNNGGKVTNSSGITVVSTGGDVYGIYNKGGIVENTTQFSEIVVTAENGTAYGIYTDGGTVTNEGQIVVKSKDDTSGYGIFATNGAKVVNKGEFVFNINNGILDSTMDTNKYCSQNGGCLTTVDGVYAIYLEKGAKLVNESSISSVSSLNLGLNGVQLGNGGQFEAKSLAGNLEVSSSVVQNGFEDEYTLSDAIKSDDVSNLQLSSESALFEANLQNSDVVMVKKDFADVVENSELASFLENNYALQNNEQLFSELKAKSDLKALNHALDEFSGKDTISRFADEDLLMQQELDFNINENMFDTKETYFAFSSNVSSNAFDNNAGQTVYAVSGKQIGNIKLGVGMAISDMHTDGKNSDVRNSQNYQFMMPMQWKNQGFNTIITPKLAYSYGTYSRQGYNQDYKGDIKKQMMGVSAQTKYPFEIFGYNIIPTVETNLNAYKTQIDEKYKQFALYSDDNSYSATLGFGAYVKKEYSNEKNQKLNFMAGAMLYHEFANPYDLELKMQDMSGSYTLTDDSRTDTYALLRSKFSYDVNNVSVYGDLLSYIDSEYRTRFDVGFKYAF